MLTSYFIKSPFMIVYEVNISLISNCCMFAVLLQVFARKESLLKHLCPEGNQGGVLLCPLCGRSFLSPQLLQQHRLRHKGDSEKLPKHPCMFCKLCCISSLCHTIRSLNMIFHLYMIYIHDSLCNYFLIFLSTRGQTSENYWNPCT